MEYYGDGDSKSFTSVENVYAPDIVKKQECIGHVRSNTRYLKEMQSGVMAALFHVASSKDNDYHTHFPTGSESWCKFNLDKLNGTATYNIYI